MMDVDGWGVEASAYGKLCGYTAPASPCEIAKTQSNKRHKLLSLSKTEYLVSKIRIGMNEFDRAFLSVCIHSNPELFRPFSLLLKRR